MRKILVMATVAVIFMFAACNKNNESVDYNKNIFTVMNHIMAEDIYTEIFNMTFRTAVDTAFQNSGFMEYFTADIYYNETENKIKVAYPSWDILCEDNLYRSGNYEISLSGYLLDSSVYAEVVFDTFAVQNNVVSGNYTITNTGLTTDGKVKFNVALQNGNIQINDSVLNISRQSEQTFVWVEGDDTPFDFTDDLFLISGESSGVASNGVEFQLSTEDALNNYISCYWISGGVQEIIFSSLDSKTGIIDFILDDSCNTKFEFTIDGFIFYDEIENIY